MAAEEDAKEAKQNTARPDEPGARADAGGSAPSEAEADVAPDAALEQSLAKATRDGVLAPSDHRDIAPVGTVMAPVQMGTRRFVFAAYFAGAIGIAFILSKVIDLGWQKAEEYSPSIGDPRDEITMPLAALAGVLAAVYFWKRTRARQLVEEVATEMSLVTWPTRTEVTNGTVVVIVTTVVSTVFFALMDKFWGFVTNLVYGGT
jgi:preprotein translocase SecE subunit